MSNRRLGRGLGALLSPDPEPSPEASAEPAGQTTVPLEEIHPGRHQPRRSFHEESLAELAQSIKAQGMMQPVLLRPRPQGGYELVAGERRWRAAGLAGLRSVPALIKEVTDQQASVMALIENIQREDLKPLDEAGALQRLHDEFGLTHQEVADAVGKSRAAVTNALRLLSLEPAVRNLLNDGALEMGHARALVPLPAGTQAAAARTIVAKGLNARQAEALARRLLRGEGGSKPTPARNADTLALERTLTERIGAPVAISHNARGKGKITIGYTSLDELDGILSRLG